MKTVIEMAQEAGFDYSGVELSWESVICTEELERFAELVRADERNSRAHSLGYGEMELSLRRNHKDDLFECRRRFSAEEVMHGPDFMVEATAYNLEVEMDRAIRARSNT
jgi:hypothetical protein